LKKKSKKKRISNCSGRVLEVGRMNVHPRRLYKRSMRAANQLLVTYSYD
jgi:hypothetical protein